MTPSRRRPAAAAAVGLSLAAVLSGCAFPGLPGLPADDKASDGVGFDDIQSATLQIEAVGTFVSPEEGGYEAAGRGSGFLISDNGLAVTNNHVVVGAGTLKVWRGGDTSEELNAKVLGSSECLDLAVIQLEDDEYPHFDWREGKIPTATDVYAAGFPLGDPEFTMTRGIVSKADTAMDTPWASLSHVIEHDARIRAGNSGGPLVDENGKLVGVNYAGNDQHDQNLAIHRDEVQGVLDRLAEGENVLSLGINGTALVSEDGEGLGVWVNSVASGSAADEAGILAGDLLTKMEGVSLGADGTMADYCSVLETHGTDATLSVELFRSGEGIYYTGQVNGDAVEAVSVAQSAGVPSGGDAAGDVEYTTVVDDTQSVAVDVPADWGGLDTSVFTDASGGQWAHIDASPDIAAFQSDDSWRTPGVSIMAAPTDTATFAPEDWLAMAAQSLQQDGCVQAAEDAYSDGLHEGAYTYWTDCGGVGAQYLMLSAYSSDGSYVIALAVQAVAEEDLATIDRVLGSFVASF